MTHPNALLTPRARLRLARLIVEDGYPATIAAKMGSFAGEGEILREGFGQRYSPVRLMCSQGIGEVA